MTKKVKSFDKPVGKSEKKLLSSSAYVQVEVGLKRKMLCTSCTRNKKKSFLFCCCSVSSKLFPFFVCFSGNSRPKIRTRVVPKKRKKFAFYFDSWRERKREGKKERERGKYGDLRGSHVESKCVEKHKFDVIIISDVVGGRLKAEAYI